MLNSLKRRKIHCRNIKVSTYETDTEDLIVEGILKDGLLISHYDSSGAKRPPNTVHHMVVRMLIGTASFQIDDIEVEVLDVPPDKEVILFPNKIGCSIRGGIEVLGRLSKENFKSYIFYKDVVLDTLGSILPQIESPKNTVVLFTKPERLRYVIKSF